MSDRVSEAADRAERLMSISKAAALLGRNRGTLSEWIRKGCPVARAGGSGDATFVDLKEVVVWREEQIRAEERRKIGGLGGEDGGERMSPSDLAKLEDIKLKRQKLAMTAKILVHREPLEMGLRQANGLGRQTVMSIPDLVSRLLAGAVTREKALEIRRSVRTTCAAALTSWSTEVASAMRIAADRAMDLDDEEDEADGEEA